MSYWDTGPGAAAEQQSQGSIFHEAGTADSANILDPHDQHNHNSPKPHSFHCQTLGLFPYPSSAAVLPLAKPFGHATQIRAVTLLWWLRSALSTRNGYRWETWHQDMQSHPSLKQQGRSGYSRPSLHPFNNNSRKWHVSKHSCCLSLGR